MNTDRVAVPPNAHAAHSTAIVVPGLLPVPGGPLTQAVRNALGAARQDSMIDDLLYLERWEISPLPGAAAAMRISQIRRANPALAAAVRAELAALR